MENCTQTNTDEIDLTLPIKLKTKRPDNPILSRKFNLEYIKDSSLPVVLNVHPKNETYKKPEQIEPVELLVGSKKRKKSVYEGYRPEKYDGRQFRHCWIKGNETLEEIEKMKLESLNADIDEEFYKEQSRFCENYLKNFVKNKKLEKEISLLKNVEKEALKIYEVMDIKHLPLDVPEVSVNILKNKAKRYEKEYEKVRDYAEGCIKDMITNCFKDDGAGPFRKQRLIVGEDMIEKRKQRPFIPLDFDSLTEASAYRIMSYYNMPHKYSDLPTMKKIIAENFNKGKYYPEEEILTAIGTARLGTNELEFKGKRHEVDELYIDNLLNNSDVSDNEKKTKGKRKQPAIVLQKIDTPKTTNKLLKINQHFNYQSSSSDNKKDDSDTPSSSSIKKSLQKTRTLPKRVTRGIKRTL